jgi:hypothetical protein
MKLPLKRTTREGKKITLKKQTAKKYIYVASLTGAFLEKPVRKAPRLSKTGLVARPRLI